MTFAICIIIAVLVSPILVGFLIAWGTEPDPWPVERDGGISPADQREAA